MPHPRRPCGRFLRTGGGFFHENSNRGPKPPAILSAVARKWWREIVNLYDFDEQPECHLVLSSALQSFDRWQEAKAIVDREGIVLNERFGQPKQHPATIVERDSKMAMIRAFKALGLDILPPGLPGRSR